MQTPATTSGDLSQDSFPRPRELGPRWSYAVDPGDAEEGYSGNGTPALARDPEEVSLAAVPLGCARVEPLPLPVDALEVDYAADGVRVVSIRAAFADAATARTFFERRRSDIEACVGHRPSPAIGPVVSRARPGDGTLVSDRTPKSDPWSELAVLDGDQVVLVAGQVPLGTAPFDPRQLRRITSAFTG